MQNIEELRKSLIDNYEKMKANKMSLKQGKELTNAAGKMINTVKAQIEYNQMIGDKKRIDFMEIPAKTT